MFSHMPFACEAWHGGMGEDGLEILGRSRFFRVLKSQVPRERTLQHTNQHTLGQQFSHKLLSWEEGYSLVPQNSAVGWAFLSLLCL